MDSGPTFPHRHGGFEERCRRRAVARVNGYPLHGGPTAGPRDGFARFKSMHPCFREKRRFTDMPPVPKPTQVGGCKDTKARERNLVKELGNIAP